MISETAYSSQTKLIGLNLPIGEHGIGYSNLTPNPQGARGAPTVPAISFTMDILAQKVNFMKLTDEAFFNILDTLFEP